MKLLEKMNSTMPGVEPVIREINNSKTGMEYYRKKLEKGALEVCFDLASENGDLSFMDANGITLKLTVEEHKKFNEHYSEHIKDRFIGTVAQYKVKEIDEENKIVYLTNVFNKSNIKSGIMKELYQAVENGNTVDVWGTVLFVSPQKVTVNIFNRSILGFVRVEDWSHAYIRRLSNFVTVGEILQLRLKGIAERQPGKELAFELSRKELHPNPWDSVKGIGVKDVIAVTIIDTPQDKSYAWGISSRFPDIEIMVNKHQTMDMRVGATYKCKVAVISPEDKKFKVAPFEMVNTRTFNGKTISYLENKTEE